MNTALASAGAATPSGFPFLNILVLIAVVAVAWPLFRRLRHRVSENRKRRWVEQGLMDAPTISAEPGDHPDQSRE